MKKTTIITSLVILTFACQTKTDQSNTNERHSLLSEKEAELTLAENQQQNFTDTISCGYLCQPLEIINSKFENVKDTIFEYAEVEWPGKIVYYADNTWTIFESSHIDKLTIWRVSTTSKNIDFNSPYLIGDQVEKILKDGHRFTFNEGEGGEYFYFENESQIHFGFRIDEKHSNEFYKKVYENGLVNTETDLNPKAIIIEIFISINCRPSRAELPSNPLL